MNKVFRCPKCTYFFDKNNKMPLTLPCGHVLCKECLFAERNRDKIQCSIDNYIYIGSVKTLPPCQTIIDHLPRDNMTEFVCKTHQDKHIKYYCSSCSLSLCSKCICKHMSPHKVISFSPVKSSLLEEIDKIMESTVLRKTEIESNEKELTIQFKQISCSQHDNSNVLIEAIETLIATLHQIKQSINSVWLSKSLIQKDSITKALSKAERDKQTLNNLQALMNNFILIINSKKKLVYEDIDKEKKNVIQQWETVLKNSINDNLLIQRQKEVIEVKPSPDRLILYKQLKSKLELFDQLFYKCETTLETPDVLFQSHSSQKSTNHSTRDLTRKSLHKQFLYNSTKNINNMSKAMRINNKSKCEESHQSPLLYTDNV